MTRGMSSMDSTDSAPVLNGVARDHDGSHGYGTAHGPGGLLVIGAGLPRTGTASLAMALEELLGGQCYHTDTMMYGGNEKMVEFWTRAFLKKPKSKHLNRLFESEGFRSVCSFPSSFFLRELLSAFPDARVVLTVRKADSWHASVTKSLLPSLQTMCTWPASVAVALRPASGKALQLFYNQCSTPPRGLHRSVLGAASAGKSESAHFLSSWTEHVSRRVGHDRRLLLFDVSEGWKPLCQFLNVPVPKKAFPRLNTSEDSLLQADKLVIAGRRIVFLVLFISIAALAAFLSKIGLFP